MNFSTASDAQGVQRTSMGGEVASEGLAPERPAPHIPSVPRRAIALMAGALVLGVLTQALLQDVRIGLGWFVLDVVLVAAMTVTLGRDPASGRIRPPPAAILVGGAAVLHGAALVVHASDWTLALAFSANLGLLAILPFVLARRFSILDLGGLFRALGQGLLSVPGAVVDTVRLPKVLVDPRHRRPAEALVRGLLLGAPVSALFIALLAADGNFAHALDRLTSQSGRGASFALWSVASAALYLFGHALAERDRARAAVRRAALEAEDPVPVPYRNHVEAAAVAGEDLFADQSAPLLRPATWAVILAQVALVFTLFVVVNARSLFAGHTLARQHGMPTYAEYLHAGFEQVSLATLLAVVLVVVGHRALRPRGPLARAGLPLAGGRIIMALELALLSLTGVTLLSCWQRLAVYEVAYGYTYLRLGVALFQLAVLGLLVITAIKSARRGWRGWGAAVVLFGAALSLGGAWFNADLFIAQKNLDRAAAADEGTGSEFAYKVLDVGYLTRLSTDARPVLAHPLLAKNGDAAEELRRSFRASAAEDRSQGWRGFRGWYSRR
jgi:hypothetical protein